MTRQFIQHIRGLLPSVPLAVIYKHQTISNLTNFKHNLAVDYLLHAPTLQQVYGVTESILKGRTSKGQQPQKSSPSVWETISVYLTKLCTDTNAQGALLIRVDGILLAQGGFGAQIDLQSVSALVAANNAAVNELSSLLGNKQIFESNSFAGQEHNIYTYSIGEDYLLGTIFGPGTKLGVIHFYTHETAKKIKKIVGELQDEDPERLSNERVYELSQHVDSELDKLFNPAF